MSGSLSQVASRTSRTPQSAVVPQSALEAQREANMGSPSRARDEAGNIWETDAQGNAIRLAKPAAPPRPIGGPITIGTPNPYKLPKEQADTTRAQTESQAETATLPATIRQRNADATKAEADAKIAQQKAQEGSDSSYNNLSDAEIKAVVEGRLEIPSRVFSTPVGQTIIRRAIAADPTFDAITYKTRLATQKDLDTGEMGRSLRSLDTVLGHGKSMVDATNNLNNFGGLATPLNYLVNNVESLFGDPRYGAFREARQNYTSESERAFLGAAGGQGDRNDRAANLSEYNSPSQNLSSIQTDVPMLKARIDALNRQYSRGMGKAVDVSTLLSPEAQQAYQSVMGGALPGVPGVSVPGGPVSPNGPTEPGGGPSSGPGAGGGGPPSSGGNLATTIATGADREVLLPHVNAVIDKMVRAGATADDIGKAIAPYGFPTPSQNEVSASQTYLRAHPNYTGSFGGYTKSMPNTTLQRVAGSGAGALAAGAGEGAAGGFLPQIAGGVSYLEGNGYGAGRDQFKVSEALMQDAHPGASLAGNVIGGILPMGGLEAGAARAGLGKFAAPAAEATYGGVSGYNKDGAEGALTGAIAAPIAGVIGRRVLAPIIRPVTTAIGGVVGKAADSVGISLPGSSVVPKPSPAARTVLSAAEKAGIPDIQQSLNEAAQLGVPMSLADTSPQLRSLAGAAVRRSPTAAGIAEDALIPRARGQIDRLSSAVSRDLGPVSNIPQTSADLVTQARTAAAPLYDKAYAASPIGSPELDSLLQTPFGQTALQRARTIAANERRDPTALGFALGDDGTVKLNPVATDQYGQLATARSARDDLQQQLDAAQRRYSGGGAGDPAQIEGLRGQLADANQKLEDAHLALSASPTAGVAQTSPQYTPQTLDYVKRGMDDVLEQYRNPITGKLQLDEAGRAQNDVRSSMLTELDKLNPAYGQARSAYAGPVSARDALTRGQDAFSLSPDELGMQVANQSPEHLAQMQLGYRGALMDKANSVRDGSNPFEITLGNPNARARISTLYPDNPGTDNLFRTRDLEGQLARTNNDVLGGSQTAGRQIADQAFTGSPIPALAVDAGLMAAGHVPVATISRAIGGSSLRDLMTLGAGSRAVAKADEIAPILLNPDPAQSIGTLSGLASNSAAYRDYINNLMSRRLTGAVSAALPVAALQAQP